jgi:serine/threonine protein kinase
MDEGVRSLPLEESPLPASKPPRATGGAVASALEPAHALEAGVEIGDFRIERRLGAGGMGIVYQAQQISLNRPVALKVLGQALTRSNDVTRFQREAQAAARLKHPAIAQVYFIGQDRHLCYLAMELVDGSSLRTVLDRLGSTDSVKSSLDSAVMNELSGEPAAKALRFDQPTEEITNGSGPKVTVQPAPAANAPPLNPYLSPQACELRTTQGYIRRVAEVIREAAQALAHAHEQGVVHRDIKPDNLLLDRQGKLHLIDFGVARFFEDQAVTYTGQLVGTPLYMSPEQVTGRGAIDARTDTYSLGLVLYELLTLRPPIEATNRENLLRTIVTKPLVPVDWRNPAIPENLRRIVHKATQKDPDLRYASAAALAQDLDRFLAGQSVDAPAYMYRLDEREITAARPGQVVLAAIIFFMISFFLFMGFGSMGVMMGVIATGAGPNNAVALAMLAIQGVFAIGILALGVAIGRGLLAARGWARWTGVVMACLLMLASIAGTVAMVSAGFLMMSNPEMQKSWDEITEAKKQPGASPADNPPFSPQRMMIGVLAIYALPLLTGLLMGLAVLWALLCRSTADWFRFARDLRSEHHQARMMLSA